MALIDIMGIFRAREDGDTDAARAACLRFAEHLETGEPVSPEFRQHFIDALRAIGQGADPGRALLTTRENRRPKKNVDRDIGIAQEIYWRQRDGESTGVLFQEIGAREHLSAKRVEQIYYEWLPVIEENKRINREEMDGS
ncbi:hypothetical protein [Methylocaldum sp.]|uniref:hypothetical protein n=1 Tax=Methylocaldum sp. TaxID=1969727 RepID=UPI002D38FF08|nr:hypothetical protein [Methylocaldum sp.]HYE35670.1 hypothetical protein [Methylocaldum sp.]